MADLISEARKIGKAEGAVAVATVIVYPDGKYAVVTWARPRRSAPP